MAPLIDDPEFAPYNLTDIVATFATRRFAWHKAGRPLGKVPLPPMEMNAALVSDCEHMVQRMFAAHVNRITIDWDADRYAEHLTKRQNGMNEGEEARMDNRYPNEWMEQPELLLEPHILNDKHNRELFWFVSDALTQRRQAALFNSCRHLNGALIGTVGDESTKSWRTHPDWFLPPGTCVPHPGVVNLSPAWFQQAHNRPGDKLEISAALKPRNILPGTQAWLEETAESFALLGAFLAISHPELYFAGRAAMRSLIADPTLVKEEAAVLDILKYWASPFSAISVISNRAAPCHRDNYSRAQYYEVLATVGPYEYGRMVLPNLGFELQYDSGTVIGLCGKVVRHGVAESPPDRVSISQYMRDDVLERLGVPAAGWPMMQKYVAPKGDHLSSM